MLPSGRWTRTLRVGATGRQADQDGVVGYRFRDCARCGGCPSLHPVRHIQHGELAACVDVEVADLVLACWQAGITTTESCQSYQEQADGPPAPRGAELVFLSLPMADAERFANALLHRGERCSRLGRRSAWRLRSPMSSPAPSCRSLCATCVPGDNVATRRLRRASETGDAVWGVDAWSGRPGPSPSSPRAPWCWPKTRLTSTRCHGCGPPGSPARPARR